MLSERRLMARFASGALVLIGAATCMDFGFPTCRIRCESNADCPSYLVCSEVGLCGTNALEACGRGDKASMDAAVASLQDVPRNDAGLPDATPSPGPAFGGNGGAAGVSQDATAGDPSGCRVIEPGPEQLCLAEACLQLSAAMRDALVLWLEPSALGEVGTSVDVWCDRSGQRNHGYPGANDALSTPLSIVNDESRTASLTGLERSVWLHNNWLYIAGTDEKLSFGAEDFLVLLVGSVLVQDDLATPDQWGETTLFRASGVGRYLLSLSAEPPPAAGVRASVGRTGTPTPVEQPRDLFDARSHLHGLRRSGSVFQYRLNGIGQGNSELPSDLDLSSPENITGFGSGTLFLSSAAQSSIRLTAALIFRGPLDLADVQRTEEFLCGALGGCLPLQSTDAGAL